MTSRPILPFVLAFAFTLGLAGCGDDAADEAANPTPQQNTSEAEPEGVGGTTNN
jgi:hypothetical protein